MPSLDNYYTTEVGSNGDITYTVRQDLNLSSERKAFLKTIIPLVKLAEQRGQLRTSSFADYLGIGQVGKSKDPSSLEFYLDGITSLSAFMFHEVEQFNRQVTMLATYNLELSRIKNERSDLSPLKQQELAAQNSLSTAQELNGGAVLETAAPLAQQGLGRVALMYKGYGIQMTYTMLKSIRQLIFARYSGNTANQKRLRMEAFGQIGGTYLTALFFAGAQGMPFVGAAMMIWNSFLEEDEDDAETIMRKYIGEGWYRGALTNMSGVDVSKRVALTNLLLQTNRYSRNTSVEEDIFLYAGGPAWSVTNQFLRGGGEVLNGNMQRGIESMTPTAVRNGLKALRYGDEGIRTRRNDPILDDITNGQLMGQWLGFAPSEYTRRQEEAQGMKRIAIESAKERSQLLKKYYMAISYGDNAEQNEIIADIEKYNSKIQENFPRAVITPDSIKRSVKAHLRQTITMHNGVAINPMFRHDLLQYAEDRLSVINRN